MNERIRFGQPIEPSVLTAELPYDFSAKSNYSIGEIFQKDPFQVYLLRSVWVDIWNHVDNSRKLECSGVLVGSPFQIANGSVTFVVVVGAISHGTSQRSIGHVTVGPEEIAKTRHTLEQEYSGLIPVGWYHSHPGHGIFLSGQDMVIVRSIYNLPWHIALVVDPIHNKAGIFQGSEARRLPGWRILNEQDNFRWKDWIANIRSMSNEVQNNPLSNTQVSTSSPQPPSNESSMDCASLNDNTQSTHAVANTESRSLPDDKELSERLAEENLKLAYNALSERNVNSAIQRLHILQTKHPEYQPDAVKKLQEEIDSLRAAIQTPSEERRSLPPPHANRHTHNP